MLLLVSFITAVLFSTGLGFAELTSTCPDASAPAATRVATPLHEPMFIPVLAQNEISADLATCDLIANDLDVVGFAGLESSIEITLEESLESGLTLGARGTCDTLLLVQGPGGKFFYDDDGGSAFHPLLTLSGDAGTYRIWLGYYSHSDSCDAQVSLANVGDTCPGGQASLAAAPSPLRQEDLHAGIDFPLTAGGQLDLNGCDDLAESLGAQGFVTRAPNFIFEVDVAADQPLSPYPGLIFF